MTSWSVCCSRHGQVRVDRRTSDGVSVVATKSISCSSVCLCLHPAGSMLPHIALKIRYTELQRCRKNSTSMRALKGQAGCQPAEHFTNLPKQSDLMASTQAQGVKSFLCALIMLCNRSADRQPFPGKARSLAAWCQFATCLLCPNHLARISKPNPKPEHKQTLSLYLTAFLSLRFAKIEHAGGNAAGRWMSKRCCRRRVRAQSLKIRYSRRRPTP